MGRRLAFQCLHLLLKRLDAAVERIHARHRLIGCRLCMMRGIKRLISRCLGVLHVVDGGAADDAGQEGSPEMFKIPGKVE